MTSVTLQITFFCEETDTHSSDSLGVWLGRAFELTVFFHEDKQHYLDWNKQTHNWINERFALYLCKRSKQYKKTQPCIFKYYHFYHLNKLGFRQCSHHCHWVMAPDVDTLIWVWSSTGCTAKLETTNSAATEQSQHHYWLHLNKQMGIYQAVFIPSVSVQEATQGFLSSERQNKETQTEETIVHCAARATRRRAVALKDGFALRPGLGGRKDIKAFSQSWQKNTGK